MLYIISKLEQHRDKKIKKYLGSFDVRRHSKTIRWVYGKNNAKTTDSLDKATTLAQLNNGAVEKIE